MEINNFFKSKSTSSSQWSLARKKPLNELKHVECTFHKLTFEELRVKFQTSLETGLDPVAADQIPGLVVESSDEVYTEHDAQPGDGDPQRRRAVLS